MLLRGSSVLIPFPSIQEEIDHICETAVASFHKGFSDMLPAPMDVVETKEAYLCQIDVPGLRSEDLEISIADNVLTIQGKQVEESSNEGRYRISERRRRAFQRQIRLGRGIDIEHIKAQLKDGVLTITLPKAEEVRERRIEINVS